jgi:hypothetical protein
MNGLPVIDRNAACKTIGSANNRKDTRVINKRHRIGVIGFGDMGRHWATAIAASTRWDLAAICDKSPALLERAGKEHPSVRLTSDAEHLFGDASLAVIGIYTQAHQRPPVMPRTSPNRSPR